MEVCRFNNCQDKAEYLLILDLNYEKSKETRVCKKHALVITEINGLLSIGYIRTYTNTNPLEEVFNLS